MLLLLLSHKIVLQSPKHFYFLFTRNPNRKYSHTNLRRRWRRLYFLFPFILAWRFGNSVVADDERAEGVRVLQVCYYEMVAWDAVLWGVGPCLLVDFDEAGGRVLHVVLHFVNSSLRVDIYHEVVLLESDHTKPPRPVFITHQPPISHTLISR